MHKRFGISSTALVIILAASFASLAVGQTRRAGVSSSAHSAASPFSSLPASDGVMFINVERLLNNVVPQVLAGNPAKLAKVNTEIADFKARFGIDPRAFDSVAVGTRYVQTGGITKMETVALAHGSFNPAGIVAAGRIAAKGKYQEQPYKGVKIYLFSINDQVKMLGLFDMRVRELAVAALDPATLAIGTPSSVRAAIDAGGGGLAGANTELIALATKNPNAVMGFGANFLPSVMQHLDLGNEEVSRNVSAVRQAYGSVSSTGSGLELLTIARTEKADQAQGLSDMLNGLKQLGSMIIGSRLPPTQGKAAQNALENLRITTQANELQISTNIAQADITTLMGLLNSGGGQ